MTLANKAVDTELWSYEKFNDTKACPNQRDTIPRALKANGKGGHLVNPSPTHAIVNVARTTKRGKEVFYKLDGHTRNHLWAKGLLEMPSKKLTVNIIDCLNVDEVCRIYDQYDSVNSSKTVQDQIYGLLAKHGFHAKSQALVKPRTSVFFALVYGSHHRDQVEDRLVVLMPYLRVMDAKLWPKQNLSGPELSAMLASLIMLGSDSLPFWTDYITGVDYISKGEMSAVTAFRQEFQNLKSIGGTMGSDGAKAVMRVAIPAVRHHMEGKKFKTGTKIKRLNDKDYVDFRSDLRETLKYEEKQADFIN